MTEIALREKIEVLEVPKPHIISGTIDYDLTTFENNVDELTKMVNSLVEDDEAIETYKKLRASLNNFSREVNQEKIQIKKIYERPYLSLEDKIKKVRKKIDDASASLDVKIKKYEAKQTLLRQEKYKNYWKEINEEYSDVSFSMIENNKWYNKTTSDRQVYLEMEDIVNNIAKDIKKIKEKNYDLENTKILINQYLKCLDVNTILDNYERYLKTFKKEHTIVFEEKVEELHTEETKPIVEEIKGEVKGTFEEEQKTECLTQTLISFTASDNVINFIENFLRDNGINYNIRKNEVR